MTLFVLLKDKNKKKEGENMTYTKEDLKYKKKKLLECLKQEYQKYLDYQKEYYKYNYELKLK